MSLPTTTGEAPRATAETARSDGQPRTPGAAVAASLAKSAAWRPWELVCLAVMLASVFIPGRALILNQIAILALFAISLDLVLGYAGIVTLGHAAFFGIGGYAAGLFAKHVMTDPLVGLAFAAVVAALTGLVASLLILRGSDLTRLMVTLGVAAIFYELANQLDWLTGGIDGLQFTMGPLLGVFPFDIQGRTAYAYSLAVLIVCLLVARRIVKSPFGVSLEALRDNRLRAGAIGISTNARLIAVYTLSAALAGIAGALLAQTASFANLDLLEFHRSADLVLVVVIGGTGYLWGGVFGAIVFTLLREGISSITTQYWPFWLGFFLVVLMLVGRERLLKPWTWRSRGTR